MKEAIQKAIEGGWKPEYKDHKLKKAMKRMGMWAEKGNESSYIDFKYALLDPLFWQCLGKAMGWDKQTVSGVSCLGKRVMYERVTPHRKHWRVKWHRFIDHLISGKDAESFFKELLAN